MYITTLKTIQNLNLNEEDFEWYPTTYEMLDVIFDDLRGQEGTLLDIGCGDCRVKKYFTQKTADDNVKIEAIKTQSQEELPEMKTFSLGEYYVIEKAKTFINQFDKETILVGCDFETTTLIDKNVDYMFCNPPYSDYENWVVKILKEGFCNIAYLIIPERWKENKKIQEILENKGYKTTILYNGDFLNAERRARAKIDIVKIDFRVKEKVQAGYSIYDDKNEIILTKQDPFQAWFEEFFNIKVEKKNKNCDYEYKQKQEKEFKERIDNEIAKERSLSDILVELYQKEQNNLILNYKNLSTLDQDLMQELNINLYALMEGLQQKIKGLKNKYWNELFNKLDKITERLTYSSREQLLSYLRKNNEIDFTEDNIYAIVLWVMKNANQYYNQQMIDIFLKLTKKENIKNYKSNQKTWKEERWRYSSNKQEYTHYTLEYRLIMSCYDVGFNYGRFDDTKSILNDLLVIANNLGFKCFQSNCYIRQDGQRRSVETQIDNKEVSLIEYKAFKNGNLHIFLNQEFIKAFNIEVSRLLGWIKTWQDVKNEFDCDIKEEDSKYYNNHFQFNISNVDNILLLKV